MLDTCSSSFFSLSLFLLTVCYGWSVSPSQVVASEPNALEIVKKHDDAWGKIKSIQFTYTWGHNFDGVDKSFPNCYWESEEGKSRDISVFIDDNMELCKDFFYDGENSYQLTVPQNKYPIKDMKFCDYVGSGLGSEGYSARFIPGNIKSMVDDSRFRLPPQRYFFVYGEETWMTILELVNKYPARIVSIRRNASGDDLVDIVIECNMDTHELLEPWTLKVSINTSKGYNIDSDRLSAVTKTKLPIELITESTVKKYVEIKGGYWIPSDWDTLIHNGNPEVADRVNYVINDCRINGTLNSRLNDFRFPTNSPVIEATPADHPEKVHIWGENNEPVRSFADHEAFMEYRYNECLYGKFLPQKSEYLLLRISLVVLGLIMIIVALYRLYAKER